MTPHGWVVDLLLQRTLEMGKALCAAPESHLLAQVIPPFSANVALPTRYTDLKGHTITNSEAAHLRADGNDCARGLMTKGQRLACAEVAVGKLLEIGNIGATDASGPYCYLELACRGQVDCSAFLIEKRKASLVHGLPGKCRVVEVGFLFSFMRLCHVSCPPSCLYPKEQVSTVCMVPSRGQETAGNLCNSEIGEAMPGNFECLRVRGSKDFWETY